MGDKKAVQKSSARRRREPEQVPATEFKDTCLRLIDRVQQTREEIVVTKHGRPVAKLVVFEKVREPLFGYLAGSVTVRGDIVGPIDEEWDAER